MINTEITEPCKLMNLLPPEESIDVRVYINVRQRAYHRKRAWMNVCVTRQMTLVVQSTSHGHLW